MKRKRNTLLRLETLEARQLLALTIGNLPASDITHQSATVGVEVQEVDASDPVISLFWGLTDGGTDFGAWERRELMGTFGVGSHTHSLTGLEFNTQYFYRTSAFSFGGTPWAPDTASFTTLAPATPTITSSPALFAGGRNAKVSAQVLDTGGQVPTVTLYYGKSDGGETPGDWEHSVDLGEQSAAFDIDVRGLIPATRYFFRFRASNSGGDGWSSTQNFTTASVAALVISEFSAGGVTALDEDNLPLGTRIRSHSDLPFRGDPLFYDWIELENNTDQPFDLSGYALTDDDAELNKWRFPPGAAIPAYSAIVVFASGLDLDDSTLDEQGAYHTSFRLESSGEYIGLASPEGNVVAELASPYPTQTLDVTYGFFAGASQYMPAPTPGQANVPGLSGLAPAPGFSRSSRSFTTDFQLELTVEPPGAEIRYTTDGAVPDETSNLYEGPIAVTGSVEFRARTYLADHVPSEISGESFVKIAPDAVDFVSHLPLVVIENFDKRRPSGARQVDAFISIFDVSAETGLSSLTDSPQVASRIGIRVRGQSSAGDPKTPYRLETRDQHDQDLDIAPLGLPADADWVLHGPYSDRTLVHNSIAYEMGAEIGLDAPRTRYVELFRNLNGGDLEADDYLGLYLLVESIKRSADRVNVPELDPGQLKPEEISGGYIVRFEQNVSEAADRLRGWSHLELYDGQKYSPEQKDWITDYVNQTDASIDRAGTSREYEQFIDVDSFIDSLVMHEMGRDQDAYVRSYYLHKDRGGKLTSGPLWDFNLIWNRGCCFSNTNPRGWQFDQDRPGQPTGWNKGQHNWNGKLMESWDFSQRFIDRWNSLREDGNLLSLDRMLARIDGHVAEIGAAADRNFDRWRGLLTSTAGFPGPRFPTYKEHIDDMKDWITTRFEWIDSQFRTPPRMDQQNGTVSLSTDEGVVYYTLDGSDPWDSMTGEPTANAILYDGVPVDLADGTRVIARVRDTSVAPRRTELTKTQWSAPVSRIVSEADPATADNLRVTELQYNPYDALPKFGEQDVDNDEFEFIELRNTGDRTIDLTGVRFIETGQGNEAEGITFSFAPELLQPGESMVVAANREAFQSRYGTRPRLAEGQFGGRLSNSGELITLLDAQGQLIQAIQYSDSGGWSTRADGRGSSLEVTNPAGDPSDANSWRPSQAFGGTPGSPAEPLVFDVVINELLANSDPPLVDQVELFNRSDMAIDLQRWYLSDSGADVMKFQFTREGLEIQPGSYLVLDENQFGFGFKGQDDDDVWLVEADAEGRPVRFADQFDFGPTGTDVSLGRWPNSTGPLIPMISRTFGAVNSGPRDSNPGDLNGDGTVGAGDLQAMCGAMHGNPPAGNADLDGNGRVDHDDLRQLVVDILGSQFGDANLDGGFDSSDLVDVLIAAEYQDGIAGNSTWAEGDWNCDGEFDSSDLVLAFVHGNYNGVAAAQRATQQPRTRMTARADIASRLMADDLADPRSEDSRAQAETGKSDESLAPQLAPSHLIDLVLSRDAEFLPYDTPRYLSSLRSIPFAD